jgi:hypothetical protein
MSPIELKRQKCIVYSRVVGWLTPTKNWNLGKKAEWDARKEYDAEKHC